MGSVFGSEKVCVYVSKTKKERKRETFPKMKSPSSGPAPEREERGGLLGLSFDLVEMV
jgi:hypothetical protein